MGDRVIKSDNPLVSSKIDFADFLALIVIFSDDTGGQRELNINEGRTNESISSI